jgi:DMSO/TMAO reductase YedYZ heme-binding membrane subunit
MSVGFRAVQWNRDKLVYDGLLLAAVALYVTIFLIVVRRQLEPPKDVLGEIDLRIRAFGSATFLMLTAILAIGHLTRLDRRFLPLLYNRRHFGVLIFCVALTHLWFMIDWYLVQHALPNLGTELTTWADYGKFIGFPFKVLGIAALLVLFVMAATSHDFWLSFLTPAVCKALHMGLYVDRPAIGAIIVGSLSRP